MDWDKVMRFATSNEVTLKISNSYVYFISVLFRVSSLYFISMCGEFFTYGELFLQLHSSTTLYFIFMFTKIIFLLFYFNFFFSLLISLFSLLIFIFFFIVLSQDPRQPHGKQTQTHGKPTAHHLAEIQNPRPTSNPRQTGDSPDEEPTPNPRPTTPPPRRDQNPRPTSNPRDEEPAPNPRPTAPSPRRDQNPSSLSTQTPPENPNPETVGEHTEEKCEEREKFRENEKK